MSKFFGCVLVTGMIALGVSTQAALLVDFNASSGITSSEGSLVDTWDSVVGGRQAGPEAGVASRRPELQAGIFAGGQPGVYFDGADDILAYSDAGFPSGLSAFTMAAAFRLGTGISNAAGPMGWGDDRRTNKFEQSGMGRWNNTTPTLRHFTNGGGAASALSLAEEVNYVGIISHDGTGIYNFTLIEDGVAISETVDLAGIENVNFILLRAGRIGGIAGPSSPEFDFFKMKGHVGRVQVYDTALTGGDLDTLVNNLKGYTVQGHTVPNPEPPAVYVVESAIHTAIEVTWPTSEGAVYRVQYANELTSTNDWENLGALVSGDGETARVFDSVTEITGRIYRVVTY